MVGNLTLRRVVKSRQWRRWVICAVAAPVIFGVACAGAAPKSEPVAGFGVMRHVADPSSLTFSQRYVLESAFGGTLPARLWEGAVRTGSGKLIAVGNQRKICLFGPVALTSIGLCAPTASIRRHGLVYVGSPSQGAMPHTRVTGLVPESVKRIAVIVVGDSSATTRIRPSRGIFSALVPAKGSAEAVVPLRGGSVLRVILRR